MPGISYRPTDLSLIKGFFKKIQFWRFSMLYSKKTCPGQWSMQLSCSVLNTWFDFPKSLECKRKIEFLRRNKVNFSGVFYFWGKISGFPWILNNTQRLQPFHSRTTIRHWSSANRKKDNNKQVHFFSQFSSFDV